MQEAAGGYAKEVSIDVRGGSQRRPLHPVEERATRETVQSVPGAVPGRRPLRAILQRGHPRPVVQEEEEEGQEGEEVQGAEEGGEVRAEEGRVQEGEEVRQRQEEGGGQVQVPARVQGARMPAQGFGRQGQLQEIFHPHLQDQRLRRFQGYPECRSFEGYRGQVRAQLSREDEQDRPVQLERVQRAEFVLRRKLADVISS